MDVLAHARLAGCRPFKPRFLQIARARFPMPGAFLLKEKPA
jgi:hypothetical protein